ncbi:MAG: hypothetical protein WAK40_08670 [Thermoplasmata archaeon]
MGSAIVEGTRTLLEDGAKLFEEAGSALVEVTRSAAHSLEESTKERPRNGSPPTVSEPSTAATANDAPHTQV